MSVVATAGGKTLRHLDDDEHHRQCDEEIQQNHDTPITPKDDRAGPSPAGKVAVVVRRSVPYRLSESGGSGCGG